MLCSKRSVGNDNPIVGRQNWDMNSQWTWTENKATILNSTTTKSTKQEGKDSPKNFHRLSPLPKSTFFTSNSQNSTSFSSTFPTFLLSFHAQWCFLCAVPACPQTVFLRHKLNIWSLLFFHPSNRSFVFPIIRMVGFFSRKVCYDFSVNATCDESAIPGYLIHINGWMIISRWLWHYRPSCLHKWSSWAASLDSHY